VPAPPWNWQLQGLPQCGQLYSYETGLARHASLPTFVAPGLPEPAARAAVSSR
jgi:hypothetical protein